MRNKVLHVWRFPERKCVVQLSDHVLVVMKRMALDALPNETGGTLVGHYSDDRREAHVKRALGVKTGARRGRFRFYRPPDDIDGQLAEVYRKSRGRIYYLGEWHTHPKVALTPSSTDLETLRGLARYASVAIDTPIMIILGGDFNSDPSLICILAERSGRCFQGTYERIISGRNIGKGTNAKRMTRKK